MTNVQIVEELQLEKEAEKEVVQYICKLVNLLS